MAPELTDSIAPVLLTAGYKALIAMFAVLLARTALMWLDQNTGWIEAVKDWDHVAQGLYFGLRFVGICLVVGLAI